MTDHEQICATLDYYLEEGIFDGSYSNAKEVLAEAGFPQEKLPRYMSELRRMESSGELQERYGSGRLARNGIVGRGPLSSGPASEPQEAFAEEVVRHLSADARSRTIHFAEGGSGTVYVNYYNVPPSVRDGADRENNRLMITVEGFGRDKLRAELHIRFTPSSFGDAKYKLRTKTASPIAVARYIADYINLCAESEPRVRYSNPVLKPNRYLTRFQLEKLLREQGSLSSSEISRMTDDRLRRAVGHDRLVSAGDINRNGNNIETDEFEAPAHWASAFVNDDTSGLEEDELAEFEAWCEAHPELTNVVDVSEETHIGRFNGLQTDLATYTCHILNRNGRREEPDEHAAKELSLFIENDYALVGAPNSQGNAIEKNLLSKIRKGTFDLALSERAWMYLMETGAKKYAKEFASERDWAKIFNKPTRELVAHEFATTFAEENGIRPR